MLFASRARRALSGEKTHRFYSPRNSFVAAPVEQLTFLLFLKMADEQSRSLNPHGNPDHFSTDLKDAAFVAMLRTAADRPA